MKQRPPKRLHFDTRRAQTERWLRRTARELYGDLRVLNRDMMTADPQLLTPNQRRRRALREQREYERNQAANRRRDALIERQQRFSPRVTMQPDPTTGKPRGVMVFPHPDGPIHQPLHQLPE